MTTTITKKRKVGRPRKDQPAPNPYIELEEVDMMLNAITVAINSAQLTRDSVYSTSQLIIDQKAAPGSAEALLLYQNIQEAYFTRIHADGVLDSLKYMQARFNNMRKLFTVEAKLRQAVEQEILRTNKK